LSGCFFEAKAARHNDKSFRRPPQNVLPWNSY
jgi:hypothetical protein